MTAVSDISPDSEIERYLTAAGLSGDVAVTDMRDLGDGSWIMVKRLLFHWMMVRGDFDDLIGYWDRWCYATEELAREALSRFPIHPPADYEPSGWHRHPPTGRRRPDGDATREYIEG